MQYQHILDKIWESMEKKYTKNTSRRTYLGMSSFGGHCDRKQWLDFRHVHKPLIAYTSGSFFEDGHHSEDVVIQRFRDAGFVVHDRDENGNQISVKLNKWVRGHTDLLVEMDGETFLADVKSTDDEKKRKLKKLIEKDESIALKKFNIQYYYQAQWYMGMLGLKRGFYVFTGHGARERINSKGDNRSVIVGVDFNQEDFDWLKEKSVEVITTDTLPDPIPALEYDKPLCIWGVESYQRCEAYDFCKYNVIDKPNCRNCMHVTFNEDSAVCEKYEKELDEKKMVEFYECHRYNPTLIHLYDAISVDGDDIYYRATDGTDFVNGDSIRFMRSINEHVGF